MDEKFPDDQLRQWQDSFSEDPEMFGAEPSFPARKAVDLYKQEGIKKILELGSGQGRDTIYFARNGFQVYALDYSARGIEAIDKKADEAGLSDLIVNRVHDVRDPLPFADSSFDACYSHMLFCMALTTVQLQFLSREVLRVLKPDGISVYTARHTGDAHYKKGIHLGEEMYEVGGFIVHFFNREKVELLAKGYEIISIEKFEEGELPRKLLLVALRKLPSEPVPVPS